MHQATTGCLKTAMVSTFETPSQAVVTHTSQQTDAMCTTWCASRAVGLQKCTVVCTSELQSCWPRMLQLNNCLLGWCSSLHLNIIYSKESIFSGANLYNVSMLLYNFKQNSQGGSCWRSYGLTWDRNDSGLAWQGCIVDQHKYKDVDDCQIHCGKDAPDLVLEQQPAHKF